jgi:hypothetical protein
MPLYPSKVCRARERASTLYFFAVFNLDSLLSPSMSWECIILTVGISRLPLGNPGTKCHLDVVPVESYRKYYKGEGGGFPQVRAMVNFVSPRLLMVCSTTKNAQTMH